MTINLAGYIFPNSKASLVCHHVLDGSPILGYYHDEDGDVHFSCGHDHVDSDWLAIRMDRVLALYHDLESLPIVKIGEAAERNNSGAKWEILKP